MDTLEKAELTASIRDIGRFLKSGIPIWGVAYGVTKWKYWFIVGFFQNTDTETFFCIPSICMYLQTTRAKFYQDLTIDKMHAF